MVTSVEDAFAQLLGWQGITVEQLETARTRVRTLREFFDSEFTMSEPVFAMGSYARGTMCAGERDIDLMAPLDAGYYSRHQGDSRSFIHAVRDALNDRYAATTVSSRRVAVSLDFRVIRTEVVPCIPHQNGGFWMPDGNGGWMSTNPGHHTRIIRERDEELGNKLKPVIRLLKAWNNANGHRLRSFHLEMMVRDILIAPVVNWPFEVDWVLTRLPAQVRASMTDPWTGRTIDDYLSWTAREEAAQVSANDAARSKQAEYFRNAGRLEDALERWRVVYNDYFPK